MMYRVKQKDDLERVLDHIELGGMITKTGSALIKVNLARPPKPEHPRTDPDLLTRMIHYIIRHNAMCAVAEGADGFLGENIERIGLGPVVKECNIRLIDLDLEETDAVTIGDETHYLPKCLKTYGVRIGLPATSKRTNMTFSNNIKLFVGAVPRKMYQIGEPQSHRPRIHLDLHKSVANIYRAIMQYAPFHFFVNGGKIMIEGQGEFMRNEVLVGDDAIEMDQYVLGEFGLEPPGYIGKLK